MNPSIIPLLVAIILISLLSVVFWPDRGLYATWQNARHLTERVLLEDALKHIHTCHLDNRFPTIESLAGALQISADQSTHLLTRLESRGLLELRNGDYHLTPDGETYALRIIRAHRLWESYLADHTGYEESDWHKKAEIFEHNLTLDKTVELERQLGHPTHDPHGDPIPTVSGDLFPQRGASLVTFPANTVGRIVHLEDEPAVIYEQLLAEGLHLGQEIRIMDVTPQRVRFWTNGDEIVLAPTLAKNITMIPHPNPESNGLRGQPLSTIEVGQRARVNGITTRIRGAERRRLMDLGIVAGTQITAEMRSPGGDPTAYRVRGAVIALRENQAREIKVTHELDQE